MDATRWEKIQHIFLEALALEGEARENYIQSQTQNDSALEDEVRKLLMGAEEADSFFGNLENQVAEAWQQAAETTLLSEGERVGVYQIEKELGRGGMAVVYLAKRIDGEFEQQVAIKVIKRGMDSDEVLRRFAAEKQILASLNHPHVATILGSGLAPNGLPYFVMEYAEGHSFIDYCNEKQLSIKDRLKLFTQIARTLQYAHQNLVIHRDLKPSNILITKDGQLKLLDFGIAKVLDDKHDFHTKTAMRLLTPEYASPEQISGATISTSSDIYQLGLLLFELLTGKRPFEFSKNESIIEWEKRITTTQTPTPSKIYGQFSDKEAKLIAKQRKTDRSQLKKILQSELQYIVLMCLRTEPKRRYQTAEQLAEDIERYIENRPLIARPNSWNYKTRKAFERNKPAWIGFMLLFVALVAGIITTTWQAKVAKQEKLRAEQTLNFITDLFKSPDPRIAEAEGKDIKVSEFLQASEQKIIRSLNNQPNLKIELLTILSDLYDNLNLAKEGTALEEQLLPIFINKYGVNSTQTAESMRKLANWSFESKANVDLADSIFNEAFKVYENVHTTNSTRYAALLSDYGLFTQLGKGNLTAADSILQISQSIFQKTDTLNNDYAGTLSFRGLIANNLGKLDEALNFYERELFIKQKIKQDSIGIAITKGNIASIYFKKQNFIRAETIINESLNVLVPQLGDQHKHTLSNLNNLAVIYATRGEYIKGKPISLRAYNGFLNKYGVKNDRTAASALNVAFYYTKENNYDSALYYCNQAENTFKEMFGETHYMRAVPLLARVEVWLGKKDGTKALQDALLAEKLLPTPPIPPVHYYKGLLNLRLGTSYAALNDKIKAKSYLEKAVEILTQTNGDSHFSTQAAQKALDNLDSVNNLENL